MRRTAIVILAAVLQAACFVEVRHVADASVAFREARAEAQRYQGRPGPARQVNVLVYDPDDRELTKVTVPMWLAKKAAGHVDFDAELDGDDEESFRRVKRRLPIEALDKAGLGLLVDVDEDDGEQVLVWLR
jgi:hypothetical protein